MSFDLETQENAPVPLLTVGPFGGLDTTSVPYYVSETNFPDMINFVPNDQYGGYVTALGRVAAGLLPSDPNGVYKFIRPNQPNTYLFAVDVDGQGAIYAGPYGGPYTPLALPQPLTAGQQTYFAASLQWVFVTNGVDIPIKIDLNLNVTYWGVISPTTAPNLMVAGTSTMNGVYYYCVTFANSFQESSQGEVSQPINVTNTGVALTSIPTSGDPQVTERNIYRIGGSLGEWRLVGTLSDNTTTVFTDTTPDTAITGQQLTVFRDPPQPFTVIVAHKERIWGFGTPSDPSIVYFSNANEPWGFNDETGNLPVGENSFNDIAVGMTSIGSVLVLNKRRSLYYVYGETDNDFVAVKIADTGCISGKSIASLDGMACWLNRRGVWISQGQGPQNISDGQFQTSNIKNFIRNLSDYDLQQSCGFWYDRMYHISFPTKNKTAFYDLRSQAWYFLGWATSQVYTDYEGDHPVVGANPQVPGQVVSWFQSPQDLNNSILAYITSKITDSGDSSSEKIYRLAEILAPAQNGYAYLTVICNPGNQQYQRTYPINLASATTRKQISLDRTLRGVELQLQLATKSSIQLNIQKTTIYGWVDRKLVEQSNAAASQ